MKVPKNKYPYLANLQRNDPEKYERNFLRFKETMNKPRFKESDYWPVGESSLWEILCSSDAYAQNEKRKKKEEKKKKARIAFGKRMSKAFVEGLNRQVMKEHTEEKKTIQGKLKNQPSRREQALKVLEKTKEKYKRLYM